MMERLVDLYGEQICRMLDVQYRMHDSIMKFSSDTFYDGLLTGDPSVADHRLIDKYADSKLIDFSEPIVFVDTAGANWNEELEPNGESRRNPEEAKFAIDQVKILSDGSVALSDMSFW